MAERNVHIDPNASIRELLRLLDVSGDSIKVDVSGSPVVVTMRDDTATEAPDFERKLALARSALGGWEEFLDLDAFEREIYEARENDPVKPDVEFD
jgi:hypothetical protein